MNTVTVIGPLNTPADQATYSFLFLGILVCIAALLCVGIYELYQCAKASADYRRMVNRQRLMRGKL